MTKKELEKIAKEHRETYIPYITEIITKDKQKDMRALYRIERFLGKNNYSDSQIYRLSKKEKMSEAQAEELNKAYEVENMSNCSTVTNFGYDLEEDIKDMRNEGNEVVKMVLFDENKKKIRVISGTSHSPIKISGKVITALEKKASQTNGCKYIIRIHNHPYVIAAMTDFQDDKGHERGIKTFSEVGIELLDDCIVGPYDFFSRKQ